MTETIKRKNLALTVLGTVTGIMSLLFFIVFHYSGDSVGNYYYLGAFFTSLNVTVLCLAFSHVYEMLGLIHQEISKE